MFTSAALLTFLCIGASITSASEKTSEQKLVTRVYDIRNWTRRTYDLSLDSSAHSTGFVTPANQQTPTFDFAQTGQRYPNRKEREDSNRAQIVQSLIDLIETTVDPDEWTYSNGQRPVIHEISDFLVVKQTAAAQIEIAALLQQLNERRSETVRTRIEWLILPRSEAGKILKARSNANRESPISEVDSAAVDRLPATTPHFHAELLCLNGETVSYISGREKTVTVNQIAATQPSVAAFTPLVGNASSGIAFQICPIIDPRHRTAVVTLFSTYNDPKRAGPPIQVHGAAATRPADKIDGMEPMASYHELAGIVQELRTTARVEVQTPTLIGRMTLEPAARQSEGRDLLVILTVHSGDH